MIRARTVDAEISRIRAVIYAKVAMRADAVFIDDLEAA